MESIETKLNLENDVVALKREFKYLTTQLATLKAEYASVSSLKKTIEEQIEDAQKHATTIQNDVSELKLRWIIERQKQDEEIQKKRAEVQSILDKEVELAKQEIKINDKFEETKALRDEKRQLELKIKDDMTQLESKENALSIRESEIEKNIELLEKNKEQFKQKIVEVLNQVNEL